MLIVEDDARLQKLLMRGLREEGFAVDVAANGEDGLHLAMTETYDAIVLDLMIPKVSGFELLQRLREEGHDTPVLILTARDTAAEKVAGLDAGADDYLTKPFTFSELTARLRALIRRTHRVTSSAIRIADLTVDTAARRVTRSGHELELRAKEYAILELLALRQGQIVTRSEIYDHVYGHDADNLSNVIDVYVYRLRGAIDRGHDLPLLHTIRGQGYVLKEP